MTEAPLGGSDASDAADGSMHRVRLFGVDVDALTLEETVDRAVGLAQAGRPVQHVVLNAAKVVAMERDPALRAVISSCDLVNADGMSVVWASRLLGAPLPERVTGIDLFERLVARAAEEGLSVFFLGARADVVEEVAVRLSHRHPALRIAGIRDGYWADDDEVIAAVRDARPDLLFLAVPSPRKEFWLAEHLAALGVPFVMGVGGSFDVIAGRTSRAPRWAQRAGLEWAYRLAQEPRRMWRRYLVGNAAFLRLVAREWWRSR